MLKGIYHFYQYQIKPNAGQRRKIREAILNLNTLRKSTDPFAYQINFLRKVDPYVFEEMLLLCFKERGFWVKRNSRYSGDGGLDGTVFNAQRQKILIQAKRYSQAINPAHIKDFWETIQNQDARGGYFIHTGRTGDQSRENMNKNMMILSGEKLLNFLLKK